MGLAMGDALGAPVEFSPRGTFAPVTAYRSGGRFKLPAGAWTDDTAMSLCLAESLIKNDGLNVTDLLDTFCDWAETGSNTSTGIAVGIGQNTLRVLGDYRRNGYLKALRFGAKNDGNGSLMRLAPVACYACPDIDKSRVLASQQSRATHASHPADQNSDNSLGFVLTQYPLHQQLTKTLCIFFMRQRRINDRLKIAEL